MIIITYKMKYSMNDDPVQLFLEVGTVLDGILPDTVNTYEKITGQPVTLAIIESDDVSEVIMLKIFLIDIQDIIVS